MLKQTTAAIDAAVATTQAARLMPNTTTGLRDETARAVKTYLEYDHARMMSTRPSKAADTPAAAWTGDVREMWVASTMWTIKMAAVARRATVPITSGRARRKLIVAGVLSKQYR